MSKHPDQLAGLFAGEAGAAGAADLRRVEDILGAEPIAVDRDGLPLPGRRRYARGLLGAAPASGVDAVTEVPADRWDVDAFYDPDPSGPGQDEHPLGRLPATRLDGFDAGLLRHLAARGRRGWTRSSACCSRWPGRRSRTPACRASSSSGSADRRLRRQLPQRLRASLQLRPIRRRSTPTTRPGTRHSIAADRLSYLLDLHGPEPGGRHGLLVVAGGGPPGLPEPAQRRVRRRPWPAA